MSYRVEEGDPRRLGGRLQAILEATWEDAIHPRRVAWLYTANPFGDARVWVLRDPAGEIAGYTAGLPRPVRVAGQTRRSWMSADFSILPAHRTLGPALLLRRAACEAIDRDEADLLTSFPNLRMELVHRRLKLPRLGQLLRFARPLRVAPWLPRGLGPLVAPLADPLLRLRGKRHRPRSTVRIEERPAFDERFDRLFEAVEGQRAVIGVRDSRFLDWRYARNPGVHAEALVAEDDNGLAGYLLFVSERNVLFVQDVLARQAPDAYDDLLAALVDEAARRRANSVSIFLLEGHPLIPLLHDHGFFEREPGPEVFVHSSSRDPLRPILHDRCNWFLTVGDRDV